MFTKYDRRAARDRRHRRVRHRVTGTQTRPRLAVYRSLHHIAAQIIDDERGHTIAAASTYEGKLRSDGAVAANVAAAQRVGRAIAERALSAGIRSVVLDRGGHLYHGRIKALADAAREAGLEF